MNAAAWSQPGYEAIAELLGMRAGLFFRDSQRPNLETAIDRALQSAGAADLESYLHLLQADDRRLDELLIEATVGETYFYREPSQFAMLRETILPALLDERPSNHTLRLWSAGCASGEEPYSLAMLLQQESLLHRSRVLGTDISHAALRRARQATYREWSLRGTSRDFVMSRLDRVGGLYQVSPEIRKAVRFEYLNLALDNYPSFASGTRQTDLILCRNVLIYFDRDTIRAVIARLHRSLADGGWLIVASSDPPIHELGLFEVVSTESGLFLRKSAAAPPRNMSLPLPSLQPAEAAAVRLPEPADSTRSSSTLGSASSGSASSGNASSSNAAHDRCARGTPPLAAAVDELLATAQQALDAGEYQQAAELTRDLPHGSAAVIRVKALANCDLDTAERVCAVAAKQQPLAAELQYLHAVLLMELNRHAAAADALRRVLFIDRSLPLAHFSLGATLRTLGDLPAARRAFTCAVELCSDLPPEKVLALGDDERAGDLLAASQLQLQALDRLAGNKT